MGQGIKQYKLFNSPLEVALRVLLLIYYSKEKGLNKNRITIFDYLILNTGDIKDGPSSIHPSLPNRAGQLYVKHTIIKQALNLLISKELIFVDFKKEGFIYKPTILTEPVIKYFESNYFKELKERVEWIYQTFYHLNDEELDLYITTNIGKWGSEFTTESLFHKEQPYG